MKAWYIACMCIGVILLSGCGRNGDLGKSVICQAMSVDQDEQGNLRLGFQVFNPSALGSTGEGKEVLTYDFKVPKGHDVDVLMALELPSMLMTAHANVIIYGSKVAEKNFRSYLDKVIRLNQINPKVSIFIAKDVKAIDILKTLTSAKKVPSEEIEGMMLSAMKVDSLAVQMNPYKAARFLGMDGMSLSIQGITLEGDWKKAESTEQTQGVTPNVKVKLAGLGVFQKDELLGFLPSETTAYYNILTNQANNYAIEIKCNEGSKIFNQYILSKMKSKIVSTITKEGKVHFDIQATAEANVAYEGCNEPFSEKIIKEMEKKINVYYQQQLKEYILSLQKGYGVDVVGFGEVVHRQHKKEWQEMKKKWNTHFKEATFQVHSDITIRKVGVIKQGIQIGGEKNE